MTATAVDLERLTGRNSRLRLGGSSAVTRWMAGRCHLRREGAWLILTARSQPTGRAGRLASGAFDRPGLLSFPHRDRQHDGRPPGDLSRIAAPNRADPHGRFAALPERVVNAAASE